MSNNSGKLIKGPETKKWSLKNGAQCVYASLPEAPLTCIDLWCKAGSAYEREGEEGIAHFLEHMIFKGSSKLKAGEFDLRIEALGGSSNAATGLDDVHFYVLVPPETIEEALNLLINLVLSPAIDKTDKISIPSYTRYKPGDSTCPKTLMYILITPSSPAIYFSFDIN